MLKPVLLALLPLTAAQRPADPPPASPEARWGLGAGVGNGLAVQGGYYGPRLLVLGRLRTKWWGPDTEPKANLTGDEVNTRSRQTEAAVLLGYPLPVGRALLYGGTGLAYVVGRQLGDYRYSIRRNGGLTTDATHYYAYRDYQALGLPLELGLLSAPIRKSRTRLGLTVQANLNPEQPVYCVLLTVWTRPRAFR